MIFDVLSKHDKGVVICGGGYKYFTNAVICIKLLRHLLCELPVELWMWRSEYDPKLETFLHGLNVAIKIANDPDLNNFRSIPHGSRWQWQLKPLALLGSSYRHVIFLDADCYAVKDPSYLFDNPTYLELGALFWPDFGRMEKSREIWDVMKVPYRDEPEFESGQMLIDTVRHKEPLLLALEMNQNAAFYYKIIWGDKDTFRFAFHKFGRSFGMTPFGVQFLAPPGARPNCVGVMLQHDFEDDRIFQHRNVVKWDLLGFNPRIPGYLHDDKSRFFLDRLRRSWNGRLNWLKPAQSNFHAGSWKVRQVLKSELIAGNWILDDRRPAAVDCCGPLVKWRQQPVSKPWHKPPMPETGELPAPVSPDENGSGKAAATQAKIDPAAGWSRSLRCREVAFAADSTLRTGASPEAYWWDLELEAGTWALYLVNEKGRVARMTRREEGAWMGRWLQKPGGVVGLQRVDTAFPFLNAEKAPLGIVRQKASPLHIANHAYGIGDAITGLYAAAALAGPDWPVVYHSRFARWLERASRLGLTVTGSPPPNGARDMDVNYAEQLRYAPDKVKWYTGLVDRSSVPASPAFGNQPVAGRKQRSAKATTGQSGMQELQVNREVGTPRLDFANYVILAPFAAWEARDWPETHWRRLAWLLKEAGYEIVAIGTRKEAERMERTFNKSYAYWAIDHQPEWVMDAMLDAAAVIGLDSGMIHVAGLLRVPTICIHSHLPPEFLFSHAPTVRSVTPNTGCVFCRWQEDRGFMEGCGTACSALATVGPEAVMAAFDKLTAESSEAGQPSTAP